eukprot:scaffold260458_cov13-Prasinocladus_malaysianus.AAC.1
MVALFLLLSSAAAIILFPLGPDDWGGDARTVKQRCLRIRQCSIYGRDSGNKSFGKTSIRIFNNVRIMPLLLMLIIMTCIDNPAPQSLMAFIWSAPNWDQAMSSMYASMHPTCEFSLVRGHNNEWTGQ